LTIVHSDGTFTLSFHNKGTAQGRKVASDYPHDGFGGKGLILEVGGVYLSEKLRGKAEKEAIRGQRL